MKPQAGTYWHGRLEDVLWDKSNRTNSKWARTSLRLARVIYVLLRDLVSGALTLRAMSLVYTTLLALIPLLALSFSVLKAFGVHNQLRPVLERFLLPLGAQADEIVERIMEFIGHMDVGVLGAAGLALLIYTVISLIQKIEESFNLIWHVPQTRSFGERFRRYLSVLLVGPLLVFCAMGVTAALFNTTWVNSILGYTPLAVTVEQIGKLVPYLLVFGALSFCYSFIPNTRVRLGPALAGGAVGSLLWQSAGWIFALFVASSTRYTAIYSGFAVVILFMIWLYVSWLIVLFGASVAFYCQHPAYVIPLGGEPRLSNRIRERVALSIALHICKAYSAGAAPPTVEDLVGHTNVPSHSVLAVLAAMMKNGLLLRLEDERYAPAKELYSISIYELLSLARSIGEDRYINPRTVTAPPAVDTVMDRYESEARTALSKVTVASLLDDDEKRAQAPANQPIAALRNEHASLAARR